MTKPRKIDDGPGNIVMKIVKANPIKRCHFGITDIADANKMLQEHLAIDMQRFNEKFGFDLREIEPLDVDGNNEITLRLPGK